MSVTVTACITLLVASLVSINCLPSPVETNHKSILNERHERVVNQCLEYFNATKSDEECDALKTNEARKLVFDYKLYGCVPRGAGSRFWDATFNALTEDLMKRGSPDTPEQYLTFSSCRHPYQRIALAYAVEAKRAEKSGGKRLILPFAKFVEKEVITAGTSGSWKSPYLRPCSLDCNPCCTHFDVVGDFSTLAEDFQHIKKLQRLDNAKTVAEFNDAHEKDGTSIDPTTLTRYFAGLSKALVEGIYRVYQRDFELYGYRVDNYL